MRCVGLDLRVGENLSIFKTGTQRLRIGIDGYNLAMPWGTGIASYGRSLVETLTAMGHETDGIFGLDVAGPVREREALFYDRLARPPKHTINKFGIRRATTIARMLRGPVAQLVPPGGVDTRPFAERMPRFDRLWSSPFLFERAHAYFRTTRQFVRLRIPQPPAVMHWTYPVPVVLEGARNIYTIHDVVPLRLPSATLDDKRQFRALVQGCIKHAAQLCTVSETSRRDIVDLFDVNPDHVSNTYQISSIDDDLLAENPAESARLIEALFGLKRDGYFLFYGAIEPKKNLGRLIEAYLSLELDTPLVIVAGRSWQSQPELVLLPRADDLASPRHAHLERRIIQIDYLSRHLLLRLLRGARALTFPSLYEGFGLPANEAMLLGVPVLAADTASLPEIAGDAALLVDPYDVPAIASGLRRLDTDAGLRAELAKRGPVQAERFSPARYKMHLADLYDRTMSHTA